jgi:hypothetical protein
MQPSQFRLRDNTYSISVISENYAYFPDSRLSSVSDLDDTAGSNPPATLRFLSRSYGYDQAGRVSQGYSPNQAPFRQTYSYDEFDNMTSRAGSYYWQPYQSETFTYTNNRHNGWSYNADGQVSFNPATPTDDARSSYYDAAGRLSRTIVTATNRTGDYRPSYDGDGKLAYEWAQTTQNGSAAPATSSYIVRSTVLRGEILTRLNQSGNKSYTYVPAEGLLFATQGIDYQGSPYVGWTQRDPLGVTETGKGVYDPLGNYIPFQQHDDPRPPAGSYNSSSMSGIAASLAANPFGSDTGCLMDGLPTACSRVLRAINNGQGDKVTVHGFATSVELSLFMASYASVTIVGSGGSRLRLPPSYTKDVDGKQYQFIGQPALAGYVAVQYVITPGFQLGFEPNPQGPAQPQEQHATPCEPHFFGGNDSFNLGGRAFTGDDLNVAARVVYAESSSGFSSINNGPVGNQVFDERNAIASVIYNLLSPTLSTLNAVVRSGRFQSVSGTDSQTQKFRGSDTEHGEYQNLRDRTADGRGGDCNDLRSSVDAIRRMVKNNGPFYDFNRFRGGRTPVGNSTVIGGSRFGYGGITDTGLGPW